MTYKIKENYVAVKAEVTAGTVVTLADADRNGRYFEISGNPEWETTDFEYSSNGYNGSVGIAGKAAHPVTFSGYLCPSSTPATVEPNNWGPMKHCGFAAVTYGVTGVALQDLPTADKSTCTIERGFVARGAAPVGAKDVIGGAYGNVEISATAGQPIKLAYSFQGKHVSNDDLTNGEILVLTAPDTSVPPALIGATTTLGGVSICLKSFTYNMNNAISSEDCAGEDTGILYFKKDGAKPSCTISFIMPTIAEYDARAKWSSETAEELVIVVGDFTITVPQLQLTSAPKEDTSGTVTYNGTFNALRNGGANANLDDEASIEILQGARA